MRISDWSSDVCSSDLLSASAGLAGLLAGSRLGLAQGAPKSGGRLVVAADTEPKNLNPAIVASNGVFYVASKVIEPLAEMTDEEIGRAACRERVCKYV